MGGGTAMDTTDVATLTQRIQELKKENARLQAILEKNGIGYDKIGTAEIEKGNNEVASVPAYQYSLQEKVAIFKSVFQGRDDVFAKRWYSSTTKKSGYQPVCEREWNREFCDKRKYKCADCPNRKFAPLTYVISNFASSNFGKVKST